jgi:hypothetical protein
MNHISPESNTARTRSLGEIDTNTQIRFWALVNRAEHGCWEWQGCLRGGYGKFSLGKRKVYAHRVSYFLATGVDPVGYLVTHDCDNRSNNAEALERGRRRTWATRTSSKNANYAHKLQPDQVREIRAIHAKGVGYRKIAKDFGVGRSTVRHIVNGESWKGLL